MQAPDSITRTAWVPARQYVRSRRRSGSGADPDLGDANLDSDSDRFGTGERAAAGRDSSEPTDEILYKEDGEAIEGEHLGDEADVEDSARRRGDEWR